VEISRKALLGNARAFKKRLGRAALCAVVKSNAYGHGLTEVSKTVQGQVDWFAVDNVDEAAALVRAGIRKPILILGFTPSWRMAEASRLGVRMTVSTVGQARAAKAAAARTRRTTRLHVKVETGTTRQGAELRELPEIAAIIASSNFLVFEGLSTHYADIEDTADHSYAAGQLETYRNAVDLLEAHGIRPPVRHTACTAAAVLYPDTHFSMARVGIGLYGIWPSPQTRRTAEDKGLELPLEPVLAWKTRIAQVKEVKRGTPISYGRTERMPKDGRIAVLGIGYWDGFDRGFSSVGEALVRGERCKVMGRVCMNMCMLDVSQVPGVKAEDEVILIGRSRHAEMPVEALAGRIGTIPYEIVTRINPLTPRLLV
jgi:alanine racemase